MFVMMVSYQLVVTHELYHSQYKLSRIISHSPDIGDSGCGGSPGFCWLSCVDRGSRQGLLFQSTSQHSFSCFTFYKHGLGHLEGNDDCDGYLLCVSIATQVVGTHHLSGGLSNLVKCCDVVDTTTATAEIRTAIPQTVSNGFYHFA
jgi:hypothetical protein